MSQRNIMECNSRPQNSEQNQNEIAIARKIQWYFQLYGGPQPEVFKLNTHCWDKIFDWLSMEDVLSFGRTCKAFNWVAGEYFKENYPEYQLSIDSSSDSSIAKDFSPYVQSIMLNYKMTESDWSLVSNCKSLRHIEFDRTTLTKSSINTVENVLKTVEEISLFEPNINVSVYGDFHKLCAKLKRLDIYDDKVDVFLSQKYPVLERLRLYTDPSGDGLNTFFQMNSNVRNLTFRFADSIRNIRDCNINLDDLTIKIFSDRYYDFNIFDVLNQLYQCGFYKHLHIGGWNEDHQLAGLQGLVTLYVQIGTVHERRNVMLPPLPDLKELGFIANMTKLRNKGLNVTEIPNLCTNLQRLYICEPSVDDILPFIRRSQRLVEIEIDEFEGKVIDITALNKERKKLNGARKVTFYVSEDIYLATKWATKDINLSLIEIRRSESYAGKFAHTLRCGW